MEETNRSYPKSREYTLDDQAYIDFNLFNLYHNPVNRKTMIFMKLVVPICLFIMYAADFITDRDLTLLVIDIIFYVVITVVWILIIPKIMEASVKGSIRRMKKKGALPYSAHGVMTLGEEEMTDNGDLRTVSSRYDKLDRIYVTDKALYVYMNLLTAFIVPNSVFDDEEEKMDFVKKVSAFLPAGKTEYCQKK